MKGSLFCSLSAVFVGLLGFGLALANQPFPSLMSSLACIVLVAASWICWSLERR